MQKPLPRLTTTLFATVWIASPAFAGPFDTGQTHEDYKQIVSPPPEVLLQGATPAGNGMLTIHAGQHSSIANAYHQEICEAFGERDHTDEGDITFSAASGDAVSCIREFPAGTSMPQPSEPPEFAKTVQVDEKGRIYQWIPIHRPASPPHPASVTLPNVVAHAAGGFVAKGEMYTAESFAEYFGVP